MELLPGSGSVEGRALADRRVAEMLAEDLGEMRGGREAAGHPPGDGLASVCSVRTHAIPKRFPSHSLPIATSNGQFSLPPICLLGALDVIGHPSCMELFLHGSPRLCGPMCGGGLAALSQQVCAALALLSLASGLESNMHFLALKR